MDAQFVSYCLATRAAFEGYRRGVIEASAVQHLLDMAAEVAWPRLASAARQAVCDVDCGHMVGERRGPGGNHDLNHAERRLAARGRE